MFTRVLSYRPSRAYGMLRCLFQTCPRMKSLLAIFGIYTAITRLFLWAIFLYFFTPFQCFDVWYSVNFVNMAAGLEISEVHAQDKLSFVIINISWKFRWSMWFFPTPLNMSEVHQGNKVSKQALINLKFCFLTLQEIAFSP